MLHGGFRDAFVRGVYRLAATPGVSVAGKSTAPVDPQRTQAACVIAATTADVLDEHPHLTEEIFGPVSVVARCHDRAELERVIRGLSGHLTASVHGTIPMPTCGHPTIGIERRSGMQRTKPPCS